MNRLEIQALTRFVERMATRDVTGLPKIGQGTPYDSARNAQRRAVAHVYAAQLASGMEPPQAALLCGYSRTTLDAWTRLFVKPAL